MKKIVLMGFLMLAFTSAYCQSYVRDGKEFSSAKKERTSSSTGRDTGFIWRDSKGNKYPIYISPKGSCYIIRTSSKTGKQYKSYLPKEVSEEIRRELR